MKKRLINPKGNMTFLTYMSDRGGVGYIRTVFPSLVIGSWRYKNMSFDPIFMLNFVPDPNWYKLIKFVKFQRVATEGHLEMVKYFKNNIRKQTDTPLIYEIDDLLFNIPKSNFASDYYKQHQPYIEEIMRNVDGITVSTHFLKKYYSKYNQNISVIRNRLCKWIWGEVKECKPIERKKPVILYPGSQNHFATKSMNTGDGGDFGDRLLDFIKKTKKDKYEWVFVGGIHDDLRNDPDITYHPWINYTSYPSFIKNLDFDIAIAPLEVNEFNRAKSNLKMLEYVNIGAPGIYTNIDPYEKASCKCDTEEEMISKIETLTKDINKRYNIWKTDHNTLKNKLFLEDNKLKWINDHLKLFKAEIK